MSLQRSSHQVEYKALKPWGNREISFGCRENTQELMCDTLLATGLFRKFVNSCRCGWKPSCTTNPGCHAAAHFSIPTVHWPVFSRSLGRWPGMLSGLHKSGTPEVFAQAAPDVWEQWVDCLRFPTPYTDRMLFQVVLWHLGILVHSTSFPHVTTL